MDTEWHDLDNVAKDQRVRFVVGKELVRVIFFAPIHAEAIHGTYMAKDAARRLYASYQRKGFKVAQELYDNDYFNEDALRERYESDRYAMWNPEDPRELGWL